MVVITKGLKPAKETANNSQKRRIAGILERDLATGSSVIPIYVMGLKYEVPRDQTIMKALEYAGFQLIRGCGCRSGVCGACGTVYCKSDDSHISVGLACQNVVEPNMVILQLPFASLNRARYDFNCLKPTTEEIFELYPEILHCVGCDACTRTCPMEVPVMDIIQALIQGNIYQAANLSLGCIQCGLCASQCPSKIPQYHIFQLARRICGAKITPRAKSLENMVDKIRDGKYGSGLKKLMRMDIEELKKIYQTREIEPLMAKEDWRPNKTEFLVLNQ